MRFKMGDSVMTQENKKKGICSMIGRIAQVVSTKKGLKYRLAIADSDCNSDRPWATHGLESKGLTDLFGASQLMLLDRQQI